MKLIWTRYNEVDKYAEAVRHLLLRDKYQNSIILNNMEKRKGQTAGEDLILATISSGGEIILTVWQNPPYQMLYYFTDGKFNDQAINFLVDNLIESKWDVKQIMGDKLSSKRFAEIYAQKTRKTFEKGKDLIVYRLDKLLEVKMPTGRFRQCNSKDLNFLPFWACAFHDDCNLQAGNDLTHQYNKISETTEIYHVWETDTPVAMANMGHFSDDCAKVSAVYTPPFHRGKSYATAVVWNLCKKFLSQYKDIMLYADNSNPMANRCYQKVGFKELFINSQYSFKE